MSFDLDKNVDLVRAKEVTLGGRALHVAPLTLRNIIAAADMQKKFRENAEASGHIDNLIEFVLLGLRRAHPHLTKEDLLESDITVAELNAAMIVVIEQTNGGKMPVGEPKATAQGAPGAGSSLSSALN